VLNALTEHDLQDAFKNSRSAGNCAYAWKGITSTVIMVSVPKVSVWPNGSTSPGNYGCLYVSNFVGDVLGSDTY
jgi:hypothetical protein